MKHEDRVRTFSHMHGLENITVQESFLMKQLEEVFHQSEGKIQEREKHSIWENKDIIMRGYTLTRGIAPITVVKGAGHQLCHRPWEQPVEAGAIASRR